jgi:hypothetical protein
MYIYKTGGVLIYVVPKRRRYSGIGCMGHETYCSGKFYYVMYRHVRFRAVGLYVAAPFVIMKSLS